MGVLVYDLENVFFEQSKVYVFPTGINYKNFIRIPGLNTFLSVA